MDKVTIVEPIAWSSLLKRFNYVVKSRTIGLRKVANAVFNVKVLTSAGCGVVGLILATLNENHEAMKAGRVAEVVLQFEKDLKRLNLTSEQEAQIKDTLDTQLPKEEDLETVPFEPENCPISVAWYKQPAVWIISLALAGITGTVIYYSVRGHKS
jgi:hypothetical protein